MRLSAWTIPVACLALASCQSAHDGVRLVERTPHPRVYPPNTLDRAGNPQEIAPWAISGVTRYEAGGYVGGGSLKANRPVTKSAGVGAPGDGTFGLDFVGFRHTPGRVFLGPSADPADGVPIANNYKTDTHYPKDVFNIRPVRKAVLERREAAEERRHGGEHE